MDGCTEFLPILQDFVPSWDRCPATLCNFKTVKKQGKGTADHMMPLGNWFRPSGLSVLCIINNTTAAAIVYGWIGYCVNIFIFYLGGGTLNIALLTLGTFEVAAINGDAENGAEDFD